MKIEHLAIMGLAGYLLMKNLNANSSGLGLGSQQTYGMGVVQPTYEPAGNKVDANEPKFTPEQLKVVPNAPTNEPTLSGVAGQTTPWIVQGGQVVATGSSIPSTQIVATTNTGAAVTASQYYGSGRVLGVNWTNADGGHAL